MEFIGSKSSQDVEQYFTQNNVTNLFAFSVIDNSLIRIGYSLVNDDFVIRHIAIQIEITSSYEAFVLFDTNTICDSFDVIKPIALNIADKIINYNQTILGYFSGRKPITLEFLSDLCQ